MTAKCTFPVNWGEYGSELGYWRFQLTQENTAWSVNDNVGQLKAKWKGKNFQKAKFACPKNLSPSITGVGLPKGTPYAFNPETGAYLRAGYGGVYTGTGLYKK